jgi:hypothetical protein
MNKKMKFLWKKKLKKKINKLDHELLIEGIEFISETENIREKWAALVLQTLVHQNLGQEADIEKTEDELIYLIIYFCTFKYLSYSK